MFIVSDEILERLICCQCKKYLSVKNIKVYPNRGIKCGRCSDHADAGVVSLFGVLAEQALFRCVNRFEGCNQLLLYSDVAAHEKFCIGEEYECPCCIEPFKGTGYEIYVHFKKQHADQLLVNTPEFVLEIDNELTKSYLYRKNDLLFYVNARFSRGEEELILNVMYLGTDKDASKISQMFTLHSLDTKLIYKTKRKTCSTVIGHLKCFKINLATVEFSKNVIVCRFDLNIEQVENLVALPKEFKIGEQNLGVWVGDIKPFVFGKGRDPGTIYERRIIQSLRLIKNGSGRRGNYTSFSDDNRQSASILRQPNFNSPQTQNPKASGFTGNVDVNTLAKSVVNDMTGGEKGDQWLLSCLAPLKEKLVFPGFEDQSPEEIRFGFYEAQKNGTMESYKALLRPSPK